MHVIVFALCIFIFSLISTLPFVPLFGNPLLTDSIIIILDCYEYQTYMQLSETFTSSFPLYLVFALNML